MTTIMMYKGKLQLCFLLMQCVVELCCVATLGWDWACTLCEISHFYDKRLLLFTILCNASLHQAYH